VPPKVRRDQSIHVYVDDEQLAALDALAEHRQTSRSAAARMLLSPALTAEARRLAAEAPQVTETALATLTAAGLTASTAGCDAA
jgi:predicted transcriptional regulator